MLRARLAIVVLAGGLGLVCGCSSLCNRPLFSRLRGCGPECIDLGVTSVSEGPVLEGFAPGPMVPHVPPPNGPLPPPTLMPQPTMPPLSTPPERLVPQPQQPHSQPMPYTP